MWQVLLAAAVAGSSILAQKLLTPNQENETKTDLLDKEREVRHDGSIFMFSSIDQENEIVFSNQKKKRGSCVKGFKKKVSGKVKKKCGFVVGGGGGQDGLIGKKSGYVCLKKRRTTKCSSGKCESCSSKESSLFNWGLGVGIMYMMSAGKLEISTLNSTMDETAKAVQELKAELSRRKALLNMHSSCSEDNGVGCKATDSMGNIFDSEITTELDTVQSFDPCEKFGDACMGDNLMEDQPEVMEMDQLEAEFFSELEKLPYCATEDSSPFNGVSPSELDQKLSQVLMEQQEHQIVQLESKLQKSNSKLNEKEAELQALKDCVRRLTQFSLASISDDENEEQVNNFETMVIEPKKHVVGMKRGMDFPE